MRSLRRSIKLATLTGCIVFTNAALAQEPPPPLPPPNNAPPPAAQPPPNNVQPPPGQYDPPPPGYGQPPAEYSAQPTYGAAEPARERPPPVEYQAPEIPTHAPKYSLWLGGRVSFIGFGGAFFRNQNGGDETTGNFVGNGVAPQIDVGARLSHRYVPYVFFEHGFLGAGHRFEGADASGSTNYFGIGFRFVSGDADSVAFLSDIAIGKRVVSVSSNGQTFSMSGLEFFKLGLGAEIRLSTLVTIEPLLSVALGALSDVSGTVRYSAEGSADGIAGPPFGANSSIGAANSRNYVVLGLGVGCHFDVFGK